MLVEIQETLYRLALAMLGALVLLVPIAALSIRAYLISLKARAEASAKLAPEVKEVDVNRSKLLVEYSTECLERMRSALTQVEVLRAQLDAQEAMHEKDRARWIQERDRLTEDKTRAQTSLQEIYERLVDPAMIKETPDALQDEG